MRIALHLRGCCEGPLSQPVPAGLIVAFFFLGFLGTYLLTRLWISAALARAEQTAFGAFTTAGVDERDLVILENETRSFSERERVLSAAAQDVARTRTTEMSALFPPCRVIDELKGSCGNDHRTTPCANQIRAVSCSTLRLV